MAGKVVPVVGWVVAGVWAAWFQSQSGLFGCQGDGCKDNRKSSLESYGQQKEGACILKKCITYIGGGEDEG
ncbi:hypothetical protein TYRP_021350 [Tyrophagus putrescentiae]|nr:hypothetical protein TYRP_021350 [Tyrophagus putrescentiae]